MTPASSLTGRVGLALGCGGTLGMAWTLETLHELELAWGWDARTADVIIGTSAGAELACMLGGGASITELWHGQHDDPETPAWLVEHLAVDPGRFPPLPALRPGSPAVVVRALRRQVSPLTGFTGLLPVGRGDGSWLRRMADRFATNDGWVEHPATWLVAADYATGERVALGSPGAPKVTLADAVCASWGLPGWLPPIEVDGRRFVDGGVVSPASADLLADSELDTVIVVAPMASTQPGRPVGALARLERLARRAMTKTLDAEVAMLEASGVRVLRFDPNGRDLAAMGGNFMDVRRRQATLVAARASARLIRLEELASR